MDTLTNREKSPSVRDVRPANWIPLKEEPILTRRKLKMVCVGAGFSGLTLAYKIQHEHTLEEFIDFQIYEKNPDVGGTWYENTYPGAACDVPAHAYTFVFERNPHWTKFYPEGPEIHKYIKDTTTKYNLDKHVSLNSRVLETLWVDSVGKWKIKIDVNGKVIEDEADILVNGAGFLNKWKWPDIKGLHDFKGKLVHSAKWDNSYQWEGKRVAVIGNGSSGIQIVPKMQPKVSKLVTYVRNPSWISINFCADKAKDGKNFTYTEEEKQRLREDPKALFEIAKELEASVNSFFFSMYKGHPFQQGLEAASKAQMLERLKGDPDMADKLIPKFHPGCRRLTPGDGYLESLQEPNVTTKWSPIETVTETGIRTAEGEEAFDMIVCATGFDTTFVPPWKLVGLNGATLDERWKVDPDAFFSVQVDSMPNYFIFNGPNPVISHGSVLRQVAWTCDYILKWAEKIATQDIKSMTPKAEAVADFNTYAQEFLKRTVWSDNCRSWYKNGKTSGAVTGTYPGSMLHFKEALENIGPEHFDIVWNNSKNRFAWLGNGLSVRDEYGFGEMAYYMQYTEPEKSSV